MSLVWERAPYTAGSLLVLLALADWSNEEGISWPSMERLAKKARIDKRSAQRIVRQLQKDNVIQIEEGGGRAKQHRFHIQIETVTNCRPLEEVEKGDISGMKTVTNQAQRVTSETETVTPMSPDPLVEPLDDPLVEPPKGLPFSGDQFVRAFTEYEQHRKEKRTKLTPTARRNLYKKLERMGEEKATASLEYSTAQGYTGLFEDNSNGRKSASERNVTNIKESLAYLNSLDDGPAQITS